MNRRESLFKRTLCYYAWQEFLVRYRFKFVLPRITETVIDGIRLDLSLLSLKVRNRILMGIYEAHEKRMCYEYLSRNDSVVEVGGAIGFIGLTCQKNIGITSYFIFEANSSTLDILRRNYQLNQVPLSAANLALGPGDGTIDLDVGSDFWENSVIGPRTKASTRTVSVRSASFPKLIEQVPFRPNVLILDVEGAEQFIRPEEIPAQIDKIIIEVHPHVLGPEQTYDLIAAIVQRGFRVASEESATFTFLKRAKSKVPSHLDWRNTPEESVLERGG